MVIFPNKSTNTATSTSATLSTGVTEEACADVSMDSGETAGVHNCPQGSCVRVFHRPSSLKRPLSLEKCTQSPYGLSKNVLQTLLGASVGALLKALVTKKSWHGPSGRQNSAWVRTTGGMLDAEMIDDMRLFQASEFFTAASQVA